MGKDHDEISERDISTVITLQQSHYQHIQSMAATFLSILLTLVIAAGGLISAGLIPIQLPEAPTDVDSFSISIQTILDVSIPGDSVQLLVNTAFGLSLFYVVAGFFIILIACSKFLACLDIKVFSPNVSIRGADDLSIISDSDASREDKKSWITDNSELNSKIDQTFRSAQFHLIFGSLFVLYGTLRILAASELDIRLLSLLVLATPIFILATAVYYPTLFISDVWQSYFSHTASQFYIGVVLQSQFLIAATNTALAWERKFSISDRLSHHPIIYMLYAVTGFVLLLPITTDFVVLWEMVSSIQF